MSAPNPVQRRARRASDPRFTAAAGRVYIVVCAAILLGFWIYGARS